MSEASGTQAPGECIRLANARGEWVELAPLGAAIAGVFVRDRDAQLANVAAALGGSAGCTIGRYANRIAHGRFALDGCTYQLATNENGSTLHGGPDGFAKRLWRASQVTHASATFALQSPAGDQGFPGALDCSICFTFDDASALTLEYVATTDAPTVVNLTNHIYFNLSGGAEPNVAEHRLQVAASAYAPVDGALIPTGAIASVAGTPFDFRVARAIGDERVDVNLIFDDRSRALRAVARLSDARSGRAVVVETDQPALQLFTGKPEGVALETQHFPDAPNHGNFPPTTLRPGDTFRSTTAYRFSAQ